MWSDDQTSQLTGEDILRLYSDDQQLFEDMDFQNYIYLNGKDVPGISFRNCWMDGDFSDANFEGASFVDCCIKTVFFRRTNLKDTVFHGCAIDAIELEGANLEVADFTGSTSHCYTYGPGELPTQ